MQRIILSAMLWLPMLWFPVLWLAGAGAGVAQAQSPGPIPCERAFQITWTSQRSERGYFSNRINLRNVVDRQVSLTHSFRGAGAMIAPDTVLGRGQSALRELSRTQTHYTQAELIAATTLTCVVQG